MTVQILGAVFLTFLLSLLFGKRLIPWLEKKGIRQPLKEDVEQKIYAEKNGGSTKEN